MNGRPERAQTVVRLVRRTQSRESSSRALPLTLTIAIITIFVAAWITRANERGTALIGALDPPVVSVPDAPSPGSAGPSAKATSSAPRATTVALLATSSPIPTTPPLPACRYADEATAHSAYDDWQRTIVDTISRLPRGYVPPDLV